MLLMRILLLLWYVGKWKRCYGENLVSISHLQTGFSFLDGKKWKKKLFEKKKIFEIN